VHGKTRASNCAEEILGDWRAPGLVTRERLQIVQRAEKRSGSFSESRQRRYKEKARFMF
jgi:hypothetical protein